MRTPQPQQVAFRPTAKDQVTLDELHQHLLKRSRPGAFLTKSDVIRFAIERAREAITRDTNG